MEKVNRKNISFQIGIGIIIVWCAVILLLGKVSHFGFIGWICFLYLPAFVIIVCFKNIRYIPIKNDPSVGGISLYSSWCFLALAIIINGSYIFIGNEDFGRFAIALDIILLVVYLCFSLFIVIYHKNLLDRTEIEQVNLEFASEISRNIGGMLTDSSDPDIHKSLVKLKELIDNSTNSVRNTSVDTAILEEIEILHQLIHKKIDKEEILKEISTVENLYKKRNTRM